MKRLIGAIVVFTLIFGSQITQAQKADKDDDTSSVEEAMKKIAALAPVSKALKLIRKEGSRLA